MYFSLLQYPFPFSQGENRIQHQNKLAYNPLEKKHTLSEEQEKVRKKV